MSNLHFYVIDRKPFNVIDILKSCVLSPPFNHCRTNNSFEANEVVKATAQNVTQYV